jgi:hypothetical protein
MDNPAKEIIDSSLRDLKHVQHAIDPTEDKERPDDFVIHDTHDVDMYVMSGIRRARGADEGILWQAVFILKSVGNLESLRSCRTESNPQNQKPKV